MRIDSFDDEEDDPRQALLKRIADVILPAIEELALVARGMRPCATDHQLRACAILTRLVSVISGPCGDPPEPPHSPIHPSHSPEEAERLLRELERMHREHDQNPPASPGDNYA